MRRIGPVKPIPNVAMVVSVSSVLKGQTKMRNLGQHIVNFVKREDGPTAVEYAVMLALIIVVCLTAITTLGSNANSTFTSVGNKIVAS
jgi:pilus assembly protein Flp/PilA